MTKDDMYMKKNKAFNVALATTLAASAVVAVAPTQADAAATFTDVKTSDVHYTSIMNLAERGIVSGYGDGTFRPNNGVTRGQVAKIIAGILELDTKNVNNPNFTDVSTSNEYYGPIAALVEEGIISGYGNGTYGPSNTLTRGQMAKIITNAFELVADNTENPFTDIEKSGFKEEILALYANEVTTGTTATTYDAASKVTRGQLASFVVRAEKATQSEETPEETPNEPVAPVTPGGGGYIPPVSETETALDKAIKAVATSASTNASGLTFTYNDYTTNTVDVTIDQNKLGRTIADVRKELHTKADEENTSLGSVIVNLKIDEALEIYDAAKSVEITMGDYKTPEPINVNSYITLSNGKLTVERGPLVLEIDQFVDDAIKANGIEGAAKLGDIKTTFAGKKITVQLGSETFYLNVLQ